MAYLSAGAEFVGGILLVLGLLTRLSAFANLVNMIVAVTLVHWHGGLLGSGGYQFPLSLAAIAFALVFYGGGPIALDAVRGGSSGGSRGKSRK
jgi:putative oxidoreductase